MNINEKFVNEFYNLFKDTDLYVGSREQARLTLQLKLNRFIPLNYIDRAFKNFIACGLIIDTGKTKKISKQIGSKFFKSMAQKIYLRNIELTNIDDLLKSLYTVFQDFEEATSEVVRNSDLKKLRKLEEDKNTKISSLLKPKTFNYNMNFSDVGLLHDIPRSRMLEFIAVLENYDPVSVKREMEQRKKKREEEEKEHLNKWDLICKRCLNLAKQTLALNGFLNVTIKIQSMYSRYEKIQVGSFIGKILDSNKNTLTISNDNFCTEFDICQALVDSKALLVTVGTGYMDLEIEISSELQKDLYILEHFININNDYN